MRFGFKCCDDRYHNLGCLVKWDALKKYLIDSMISELTSMDGDLVSGTEEIEGFLQNEYL